MSDIAESSVQAALVDRLTQPDLGWTFVASKDLGRSDDSVLIEKDVAAALTRLNPAVADKPERVDEVLPTVRSSILAVRDDGLMETNQRMMGWLRGHETFRYTGTDDFVERRTRPAVAAAREQHSLGIASTGDSGPDRKAGAFGFL